MLFQAGTAFVVFEKCSIKRNVFKLTVKQEERIKRQLQDDTMHDY